MIDSFAIIGAGFGLYGYLPALISAGVNTIYLPDDYQRRVEGRPELLHCRNHIQWQKNFAESLSRATGAALAVPPAEQGHWIQACLSSPNIQFLLVEKPLAHTPALANEILAQLIATQRPFRIGYTLLFTPWYAKLKILVYTIAAHHTMMITWKFHAHHFVHGLNNWKRYHSLGGGIVKFYGIHLIALLADLGYEKILQSTVYATHHDQPEKWAACFAGDHLPVCQIEIDSRATTNEFTIKKIAPDGTTMIIALPGPFAAEDHDQPLSGHDARVPVLQKLYQSLHDAAPAIYAVYQKIHRLWEAVEK